MNDLAHHFLGLVQEHPFWTTLWFGMFCTALAFRPFCLVEVETRVERKESGSSNASE